MKVRDVVKMLLEQDQNLEVVTVEGGEYKPLDEGYCRIEEVIVPENNYYRIKKGRRVLILEIES